jgi:hypothetical protein
LDSLIGNLLLLQGVLTIAGYLPPLIREQVIKKAEAVDFPAVVGGVPACKDFLKGRCDRGSSCRFRHLTPRDYDIEMNTLQSRPAAGGPMAAGHIGGGPTAMAGGPMGGGAMVSGPMGVNNTMTMGGPMGNNIPSLVGPVGSGMPPFMNKGVGFFENNTEEMEWRAMMDRKRRHMEGSGMEGAPNPQQTFLMLQVRVITKTNRKKFICC